jgi:predicted RNase H-like HicB family nuclease
MLTYKARFKFLPDGVHGEVLDFPGAITGAGTLTEARRMLAGALVDMAETSLLQGEQLPKPNPTLTDNESDLEEPIHLIDFTVNRICKQLDIPSPTKNK